MVPAAPLAPLHEFIAAGESEVVEFKQAGDGFSKDAVETHFSALADKANLLPQLRCTSRIRNRGVWARSVWRLVP